MEISNAYAFLMAIIFVMGYFLITIEHTSNLNKACVALLMGVSCWIVNYLSPNRPYADSEDLFLAHLAQTSQIVFFLLGALTIVETINAHHGFNFISNWIKTRSKRSLLWVVTLITFFLSAVIDNLTTTIVMVSILGKLVEDREDRMILGGAIVIAANAGGAWTPIGDVTTTMLWIGGQVSTLEIMKNLLLPSFACIVAANLFLSIFFKGECPPIKSAAINGSMPYSKTVFWLGFGSLLFVPIFKLITGLPPFMGIILGLSIMWILTDLVHSQYEEREHLQVHHIIAKIDISSVLFFLGILLSVNALETAGILHSIAYWMDRTIGSPSLIAIAIGLASAVIDNVPLVAASMGMYSMAQFPTDSNFWNLIAYCAGTGGSILVVGSAAGVAFMGLEKVNFFWYLRKVGPAALIGYFAGIGIYWAIG